MSTVKFINANLLADFIALITKQTGLKVKESDRKSLETHLLNRTQSLKLNGLENYYQLLASTSDTHHPEWQEIITLLTNNESYFFRDQAQLELIKKQILPEIIQRQRATKTLRICSAGCSTGEEPYTLAMLIQELIPNFNQWKILILGLDIDPQALKKAKQGIYNSWSFRGVEPSIRQKYFQAVNNQFHLCPEIKEIVKFQNINLVNDPFPQPHFDLKDIDLFICRNVFIYFTESAIAKVLDKIHGTLQPLGYLLTGHTELAGQNVNNFKIHVFNESIIYQKLLGKQAEIKLSNSSNLLNPEPFKNLSIPNLIDTKKILPPPSNPVKNSLPVATKLNNLKNNSTVEEIEKLYEQQQYQLAISKLEQLREEQSTEINYNYLFAKIYADMGQHKDAIAYCQAALQIDSLTIPTHYLLAHIEAEQGNLAEAKDILKKIIYLEPSFIGAYLNLSQLYQQEGDFQRTIKMQLAALNLLKQLPENSKIPGMGNLTARELIIQIETTF